MISDTDKRRIAHWVTDTLVSWPQTQCFHCRQNLNPGDAWSVVSTGEATARFHAACFPSWRAQREKMARIALGIEEDEPPQQEKEK